MTFKASNFAYSTLGAGINATATTITVASGQGVRFPVVNDGGVDVGDYFRLVLQDASNNFEVVNIVRHDTGSDSFTIGTTGVTANVLGRAIEDPTQYPARSWNLGDMVELRPTVGTVQGIIADTLTGSPALLGVPTAPTAANGTSTTQVATTQFVMNHKASATPAALGTAAVGTSDKYAREDHVHSDVLPSSTTATTQTSTDSTTKVATTAFVQSAISTYTADTTKNAQGTKTISTSTPSGGNDGDIWYQV